MKLTDTKIRSAIKTGKAKMSDGNGLVMAIRKTPTWQLRYLRPGGREATYTIGSYPDISLAAAREIAAAKRAEIAAGGDPVISRRRKKAGSDSFRGLTESFLSNRTSWSDGHRSRFLNRMQRDVWPVIGDMRPTDIEAIDVMGAVRPILNRGAINSAKRTLGMIGQVMTYAVTLGLARSNPAQGLSAALADTPAPVHRPAIVHDHDALGRMLGDLWAWDGGSMAKPLLQLCALTFARPGELRHMRWSDIDGDVWRYTVSKTGVTHIVPLSRQALAVIESVRPMTGRREYVLANPTSGKPISDVMASRLLERLGWSDVQSAHGFRAVARTELVETLDYDRGLVEFQLSHRSAELHAGAYDRTTQVAKRRAMMQAWADWLDSLRHKRQAQRLGISAIK